MNYGKVIPSKTIIKQFVNDYKLPNCKECLYFSINYNKLTLIIIVNSTFFLFAGCGRQVNIFTSTQ